VLIANDDSMQLYVLKMLFEKIPLVQVTAVINGYEAFETVK
jgi:CheY-like chemotaxis protein